MLLSLVVRRNLNPIISARREPPHIVIDEITISDLEEQWHLHFRL
jgi:hypothetical protein